MSKVCGTGGDDDGPGQVEGVDLNVLTRLRGLNDLAAAQVHHDVVEIGRSAFGSNGKERGRPRRPITVHLSSWSWKLGTITAQSGPRQWIEAVPGL